MTTDETKGVFAVEFFTRLFDTSDFPARWHCGQWSSGHGWLHVLSDLGVWSAYLAIPLVLMYFIHQRHDLPFRKIFLLFGAFIFACGTTHLMEAIIFWWPAYRLAGMIKLFTALVSWGTVLALVRVVPQVLAMRSPEELEREIDARRKVEAALQQTNEELQRQFEALRASEEKFRLLVESTEDYGMFLVDPAGHVASWNPGAERIKQYRAEEVVGRHFRQFFPVEDRETEKPQRSLDQAAATGRHEDEGWRVRKDGTRFWANVVTTALRDERGELRGFSKVVRDMTERKQAEENARRLLQEESARRVAEEHAQILQEQRERLRVTLASIGDAVISTDAQGQITFLNPVAEQLTGWGQQDASGKPLTEVFQIINETTRDPVENPALRALQEGVIVGLANHTLLVSRDGTEHPIDDSAAPIRDGSMGIIGSVLVFRDISGRKQSEQALRTSEERLRLALDVGRMGVWDWNLRTNELRWSDNLEAIHGLPPGGFRGTLEAFQELVHPEDRERVAQAIQEAVQKRSEYDSEFRICRPDGCVTWIAGKGKVFDGEDGKPMRMIGLGLDVTERKRSVQIAQFLANASATLSSFVDFDSTLQKVASLAVPDFADWAAVDLVEADGSLRRVAVAHSDPAKVALAHEVHRRFPPDPDAPHGVWTIVRTGRGELVSEITDDLLVASLRDPEQLRILRELGLKSYIGVPLQVRGKTLGAIVFISAESGHLYDAQDLAAAEELARRAAIAIENSQLYQELRDADRRKDEFLAMLAHELRNPLAPIRNGLQILRLAGADSQAFEQSRSIMERQVVQMVRLVDDLLDVSRITRNKLQLRIQPVELASVVANAVETSRPLIEEAEHELIVQLPPEPISLVADPTRLAQVFANLLNNAAKYTERGGQIVLSAECTSQEVVIRVRDNGIGIPPEALSRIFELFSQGDRHLARAQGGLGIGLTLVRRLVEMHGGEVHASSEGPGAGSEFVVRLPLSVPQSADSPGEFSLESPSGQSTNTPSRTSSQRTGHRLLVVDDNQDAADSLAMLLRLLGHDVRVAHEGHGALEIIRGYRPEMVFLDIGMPGMDGYEVARRIRQQPGLEGIRLAALTGWGQHEDRVRSAEAGFDHHLVKPPEPAALESLLADLSPRKS